MSFTLDAVNTCKQIEYGCTYGLNIVKKSSSLEKLDIAK